MFTALVFIALVVVIVILQEIESSNEIKKFWRDWEGRSFEFKGGRYAKDTFEVVDGELRMKS